MSTYVPIQAITLSSTATSIAFTNIPQTYTDLVLVTMARDTRSSAASDGFDLTFNTDTSTGSTNYSTTILQGNGSSASSTRFSNQRAIVVYQIAATDAAADTFGVTRSYIQNYSNTTTNKTVLTRGGIANALDSASVGLWRSTAAINAITLYPGFNGSGYSFTSGSTFTLYGIAAGTTKAIGGEVTISGGYAYHTFRQSGVFTPLQNLTLDYLVVAGGGGGGGGHGGGGGGGGLRSTVTATGGGGSLESAISVTANVDYTITVGAGGAGGTQGTGPLISGRVGNNSSISGTGISTITSNGGGGGGSYTVGASSQGGSGGGGGGGNTGFTAGSTSNTTGQGYSGGNGTTNGNAGNGAGGGGAGQAGSNATGGENSGSTGKGGDGVQITALATPTNTGANSGYYAGGGSGGAWGASTTVAAGGLGGGGQGGQGGQSGGRSGAAGTANTGGGSGGGSDFNPGTNAGGSGIVIVRYAL